MQSWTEPLSKPVQRVQYLAYIQTVLPAHGDRLQRVLHYAVVDPHVGRVGLIDQTEARRRNGRAQQRPRLV
jgi:hypothetical protein